MNLYDFRERKGYAIVVITFNIQIASMTNRTPAGGRFMDFTI